jgi:hypothetical protein
MTDQQYDYSNDNLFCGLKADSSDVSTTTYIPPDVQILVSLYLCFHRDLLDDKLDIFHYCCLSSVQEAAQR